jgi:hypothetical protein
VEQLDDQVSRSALAVRASTIKAAGYWIVLCSISIVLALGLHLIDLAIHLALHR